MELDRGRHDTVESENVEFREVCRLEVGLRNDDWFVAVVDHSEAEGGESGHARFEKPADAFLIEMGSIQRSDI